MNKLNSELKEQAVRFGLCELWTSKWNCDRDEDELAATFKRGQDFCINHDWPTLDFIRSRFDPEILASNGIFVDDGNIDCGDISLLNGTYVLLGKSQGTLRFGRHAAALVYVRHDSSVRIQAGAGARIIVRMYDRAEAEAIPSPGAQIRILDRRKDIAII